MTMTVQGMAAGLPSGQSIFGPITTTATEAGVVLRIGATLSSGDNTFSMPSGSTYTKVLINLGTGPTAAVKVRTNLNAGDTGLPIAPYPNVGWTAFDLVSGVTEIILNASGTVTDIELDFI